MIYTDPLPTTVWGLTTFTKYVQIYPCVWESPDGDQFSSAELFNIEEDGVMDAPIFPLNSVVTGDQFQYLDRPCLLQSTESNNFFLLTTTGGVKKITASGVVSEPRIWPSHTFRIIHEAN